ncbi:MAG: carboxypeptidase regulatory-like domain-containing protein [Verrucomicrobiia bacterium]|jgi:plastocyanin
MNRLGNTIVCRVLTIGVLLIVLNTQAQTATIEGTVSLTALSKKRVTTPRYGGLTVKPGKPELPTAVVYLDGSKGNGNPPTITGAVVQKELQFRPALLPIQIGTTVNFPNGDPLYHNVFSYSKTKRFDLGRYMKDETSPGVVFDKAGEVKLFCEIHSHMRASILVLETPHFVKTDADGKYHLENLPAGEYVLKAWLSSRKIHERPVTLKAGGSVRVDFAEK